MLGRDLSPTTWNVRELKKKLMEKIRETSHEITESELMLAGGNCQMLRFI